MALPAAATAAVACVPETLALPPGQTLPADTLFALAADDGEAAGDARRWRLPLMRYGATSFTECWRLPGVAIRSGSIDDLCWSEGGGWLFARLALPASDARAETASAYRQLATFVQQRGYAHWLRTWNYLGAFNEGAGDTERYRQFCVGRAEALQDSQQHPAATAIGCAGDQLEVAVLASQTPGVALENPRQTAAWRYPRDYGPQSPGFSRGMLVGTGATQRLLLSGTASVVGHETRHPHDAAAQLPELLANVEALLASTEAGHWQAETLKLYVRREEDMAAMATAFAPVAGKTPWLLLQGDISRRDLMVEVEGVYRPVDEYAETASVS